MRGKRQERAQSSPRRWPMFWGGLALLAIMVAWLWEPLRPTEGSLAPPPDLPRGGPPAEVGLEAELERVMDLLSTRADAEAVRLLSELERRVPRHPEVRMARGILHNRQNRFAEAEALFRELVAEMPEDALARYNLAAALVNLGRLDEALTERRHALQLEPRNRFYHLGLCRLLAEMERHEDLLLAAARWREVLPGDGQAYYFLGLARSRLGDAEAARQALGQALELSPDLTEARSELHRLESPAPR